MPYFPPISKALVLALSAQYPERSADLSWSEKEVWFRAGQASVARFVEAKFTEQEEGVISLEEG